MTLSSRELGALGAAVLGAVACSGPPAPQSRALPLGVVARVAGIEIRAEEVGRIAAAQKLSVREARDAAVRDALLVAGAKARGLDRTGAVERSIAGEHARRMLLRLLSAARATPPTAAELTAAAARKWLDVDRPEGFRTVHAVVTCKPEQCDEAQKAKARELAAALHAAAEPVAKAAPTMPQRPGAPMPTARQRATEDPDPLSGAFRSAMAAAVPPGAHVVIEPLPAVAADGRALVPGDQRFDIAFARAAAALPERGALSPVVESSFGFHVILLLERQPPLVLTGEARVERLRDDIVNERARAAEQKLLATLRPQGATLPEARGLIDLISVEP